MNRLEKLRELERAQPDDAFLKFAIALEYVHTDKKEAMMLMEAVRLRFPNYIPTYYQLGKLLEESNKAEEAANIYQEGIKLASSSGDTKTLRELKEALQQLQDE